MITETILVRRLGSNQANIFTTRAADVMTREFTACRHGRSIVYVMPEDSSWREMWRGMVEPLPHL